MMSLRTRVLTVFVLIGIAIVFGAAFTAHSQRAHLVDAIDARIIRMAETPKFIDKRASTNRVGKPAGAGLSDTYLGITDSPGGELRTLSSPDDNADFIPDTQALEPGARPRTVNLLAGTGSSARAASVELESGSLGVIAIPLTAADVATRQLRTTLVIVVVGILLGLALLAWWILRLGIRPMRELTAAATEVSRGQSPDVSSVIEPSREASNLKSAVNDLISATRANEARMRQFVQDASHELRTPLTTLRGYASHASTDPRNIDIVTDALARINEESLRMSRLVDDLLTLARSDEPGVHSTADFDLARLVHDVAADLRVVQPDRRISVDAPETAQVSADKALVTQAILAITSNAIRHTPVDSALTLSLAISGDHATVTVVDEGPGIPSDEQPRLFDRFYRGASGKSGSGLGLAIFASIIEKHAGTYGVESSPERGSRFWFTIPTRAGTGSGRE